MHHAVSHPIIVAGLIHASVAVLFLIAMPSTAQEYDLADPSEPWLEAQAGVTTQVPPPFEPLALDGSRVSMWGREYELGGVLPLQIRNQGKSVFVRPPQIIFTIGGTRHESVAGAPTFGSIREDRIEFSGVTSIGPVRVSNAGWLEFDGVLRADLTLTADQPLTVEAFQLEFSLAPEVARYLHCHTIFGEFENLDVVAEQGATMAFPWRAMWWLGDDDRGLSVFYEDDFDWTPGDSSAVEIVRQADAVVLRFNIWSAPFELTDEVTFTLGMHATPAKPLPSNWHGRHATFYVDESTNVAVRWHGSEKYYGYPEPKNPADFRKDVERLHGLGHRVCPYFTPSATSPESPPVQRHRDEWLMTGADGKPLWEGGEVDNVSHGSVSLCPVSSFADFLTWGVEQMVREYDIDGVYLDNVGPYPCMNAAHGCGRDGKPSYRYFAVRELHKRLYTILQTIKPGRGLVWEHNSRFTVSSNLSFVDIYSDGEQFRNPDFDRHAISIDHITPTFRAMTFTGSQWGAQPSFLPSAASTRIWLTPWLVAITMPYGNVLLPAPGWMDYTHEEPLLEARLEFGLGSEEVEWYRPHELPPWLDVGDHLVGGAYVRERDGHTLLVVSNLGEEPATLKLSEAALEQRFGKDVQIVDASTGASTMGKFELAMPAAMCRMFLIHPSDS